MILLPLDTRSSARPISTNGDFRTREQCAARGSENTRKSARVFLSTAALSSLRLTSQIMTNRPWTALSLFIALIAILEFPAAAVEAVLERTVPAGNWVAA